MKGCTSTDAAGDGEPPGRCGGIGNGHRGLGLFLLAALTILPGPFAWAVGGAESMDRPSARPLPQPEYVPKEAPEGFTLPKVPESPAPGAMADQRRVLIQHIVLTGNHAIPKQELRQLVHPYEGRTVTVAELEDLRQQLTRHYIDRGYVNSGAIIPADALKDGTLRLQLVEGRLDEVRLHELQDRFQLLLSDPLINRMSGRILPGTAPGHAILDVDVTRAALSSDPVRRQLSAALHRRRSLRAQCLGAQPDQVWAISSFSPSIACAGSNRRRWRRVPGGPGSTTGPYGIPTLVGTV